MGQQSDAFFSQGDIMRRLREVEAEVQQVRRERRLENAAIGAGGLRVKDGGKITFLDSSGNTLFSIDENGLVTFEADGSQLSVLDGSKLRFNRGDGTRILEITPAGGVKVYAANGTTVRTTLDGDGVQVGNDVVIDADGLHLEGGDARAIDFDSGEATANNQTLTTTLAEKASFTVAVPTWANQIRVFCVASVESSDGGFGPLGVIAGAQVDDVDDGVTQSDTDGLRTQAVHITEKTLSTFGSTVKFSVYARRNGGSGNPTSALCAVWGWAVFLR